MSWTLDWRLPSLVTNAWGANTFPVRKQLLNPYSQILQTFVFLVFLSFSTNKCWWWLHSFSPMETNAFGPWFLAFSNPHRGVGCDSWRLHWGRVRELGHLVSVQCFYHDFFFTCFPFSLLSLVLSIFVYNLCCIVVFGVCLSINYIHS